jgi:hypothetical protein
MAYSKEKLKSNGDKSSPCRRVFQRLGQRFRETGSVTRYVFRKCKTPTDCTDTSQ